MARDAARAMLIFEPQTWATLAGAAYLASSPVPDGPGLHAEQFVPGRGLVVYAIGQGDPALTRSGLTRKLRRQETTARPPSGRLMVYEFGRRALPLHRTGRADPGLLLAGGLDKRTVAPRGCGGFDARCDSLNQTRRISLGLGYGDPAGLISLTYFNDRLRGFGGRARYADGAQLTLLKTYDRLF